MGGQMTDKGPPILDVQTSPLCPFERDSLSSNFTHTDSGSSEIIPTKHPRLDRRLSMRFTASVFMGIIILCPLVGHADVHFEGPEISPEPENASPFDIETRVISSSPQSVLLETTVEPADHQGVPCGRQVGLGMVAVAPSGQIRGRIIEAEVSPVTELESRIQFPPTSMPDGCLRISTPAVWRDLRVIQSAIVPCWKDETKTFMVRRVVVEIVNIGGKGIAEKETRSGPVSPMWERLYRAHVLNYDSLDLPRLDAGAGARYLIISRTRFDDELPQLLEWKTRQGYGVDLVALEDLGYSNPYHRAAIDATRRYIMEAYPSWPEPLEFVLLVGDMYAGIPSGSLYSKTFQDILGTVPIPRYYDTWYTLLDGPDLLPDVMIGRLPDTSTERLDYMIAKSIDYEMNPYIDGTWQKNAAMTVMHSNPNHITIQTKRAVSEDVASFGMNSTLLINNQANPATLIPLINQGLSFYNFRGEWCAEWSWGDTFDYNSVPYVNNLRKLGIYTILSCSSADIVYDYPSVGELMLRHGFWDPTNPIGAVAFVGSQAYSWVHTNNALDIGMYDALIDEGASILGEMLVSGKARIWSDMAHSDTLAQTMKMYTILGDPSLQFWTEVPQPMLVSVNPSWVPADQATDLSIAVADSVTADPIADALVCLMREDDVYAYGYTDDNGNVILPIAPQSGVSDDVDLTVTAYNRIPVFDTLPVGTACRPRTPSVSVVCTETGNVLISWEAIVSSVRGAPVTIDFYEVYTEDLADFPPVKENLIETVSARRFLDSCTSTEAGGRYYRVVAVSASGDRSVASSPVGLVRIPLDPSRDSLLQEEAGR